MIIQDKPSPAPVTKCRRSAAAPSGSTPEPAALKRQLKGIERYFLRCPNANVVVVTRINRPISAHCLGVALHHLRKKHPLLGARVSLDSRGIAWLTSEGVPENLAQVEQVAAEDPDAWVRRVSDEQRFLFPLDKGPLIRFVLFNHPETAHLIINCHHSICDIISITYLIHEILSHAGHPERALDATVDPAARETAGFPATGSVSLLGKIRMSILNRLWAMQKISFSEEDYQALHRKYWSQQKANRMLSWALTESQTADFISRCRREKVTVNSAIVTAFLAAQRDVQGAQPAYLDTVSIPVDIRSRLRPRIGQVFGLYVSSFKTKLSYRRRASFWANVRETHARIGKKLTDKSVFLLPHQTSYMHSTLLDSIYFMKYGLLRNRIASFFLGVSGVHKLNTGLEVSNVGQYKFAADYGPLKVEAIFLPGFLSDYQEKCLRVITVDKKMFFTLTFWEDIIDNITAQKIRDASMAYLSRATGWAR